MKKVLRMLTKNFNEIVLDGYIFLIWAIYFYKLSVAFSESGLIRNAIWEIGTVIFIFICLGIHKILKSLQKLNVQKCTTLSKKERVKSFCIFSGICFLILLIWYIAYYPGGFSVDNLEQYSQAMNGNYNDWHPVWHTLLFFTLPVKLSGLSAAIVFLQIVYFSLILGYMAETLHELISLRFAVIAVAYIILNPYTGKIAMYPWKDMAFGMASLWAMTFVVRIYYMGGQWSDKKGRVILMGIVLASATLFRHNAILFTIFLIFGLFFFLKRKQWLKLMITFFVVIVCIKGPIYSAISVIAPNQRLVETVGLPLTILGNVVKETPEALDEEMQEFAYTICPQSVWEEKYVCGNFNSIKWNMINLSVIEEKNLFDIAKLTLKCFKNSPKASLKAFVSLTDMVYGIGGEVKGDIEVIVDPNDKGIVYKGNSCISFILQCYKGLWNHTILKFFGYIGMSMLLMSIFISARSNLKKRNDWKRLALCIPIFTYNFGTMLLLTGWDSRFFYVSFLICPLVIAIMIGERKEEYQYTGGRM